MIPWRGLKKVSIRAPEVVLPLKRSPYPGVAPPRPHALMVTVGAAVGVVAERSPGESTGVARGGGDAPTSMPGLMAPTIKAPGVVARLSRRSGTQSLPAEMELIRPASLAARTRV